MPTRRCGSSSPTTRCRRRPDRAAAATRDSLTCPHADPRAGQPRTGRPDRPRRDGRCRRRPRARPRLHRRDAAPLRRLVRAEQPDPLVPRGRGEGPGPAVVGRRVAHALQRHGRDHVGSIRALQRCHLVERRPRGLEPAADHRHRCRVTRHRPISVRPIHRHLPDTLRLGVPHEQRLVPALLVLRPPARSRAGGPDDRRRAPRSPATG